MNKSEAQPREQRDAAEILLDLSRQRRNLLLLRPLFQLELSKNKFEDASSEDVGLFEGVDTHYLVLATRRGDRAEYFGDLDAEGLAIPAHFNARQREKGLPEVRPAERFYAWLLDHGHRQPRTSSTAAKAVEADIAWLPENLRFQSHELLAAGLRVPQEALGYEILIKSFTTSPRSTK